MAAQPPCPLPITEDGGHVVPAPSWHTQNGRPKVLQRPAASLLPTKVAAVSLQSSQAACEGMGCQLEEGRLGCGV